MRHFGVHELGRCWWSLSRVTWGSSENVGEAREALQGGLLTAAARADHRGGRPDRAGRDPAGRRLDRARPTPPPTTRPRHLAWADALASAFGRVTTGGRLSGPDAPGAEQRLHLLGRSAP